MSKVLVIHPDDKSTDFLKLIYEGKDYDVINSCDVTDKEIRATIKKHDKIIMIGHGNGFGLINPRYGGLIINDSHADLLREKETVSIWGYSDRFSRRNNIRGLHTGIIISEVVEELLFLGYEPLDKDELLNNMEYFATIVGECIEGSAEWIKKYILEKYIDNDPVTDFNRNNIIVL